MRVGKFSDPHVDNSLYINYISDFACSPFQTMQAVP